MNTILLVEDSEAIVMGLKYSLEQEGFRVITAKTIAEAENCIINQGRGFEINKAKETKNKDISKIDLILLDITLPDGNGFDFFKELKKKEDVPVIFLTARDEEIDIVKGLDLGAEDYIVKPFRVKELISRIKVALRRYNKLSSSTIECNGIILDTENMEVKKDGKSIELTSLEFKILLMLFTNKNKLVTREAILNKIWDLAGNFVNDNTLTVYIKRIREKLGDTDGKIIKTIRGVGYKVDEK